MKLWIVIGCVAVGVGGLAYGWVVDRSASGSIRAGGPAAMEFATGGKISIGVKFESQGGERGVSHAVGLIGALKVHGSTRPVEVEIPALRGPNRELNVVPGSVLWMGVDPAEELKREIELRWLGGPTLDEVELSAGDGRIEVRQIEAGAKYVIVLSIKDRSKPFVERIVVKRGTGETKMTVAEIPVVYCP